jgi:hypothetical protein
VRLTERRFGEHATPPRRLEQLKRYGSIGADQLVFGMPLDMPKDAALESARTLG